MKNLWNKILSWFTNDKVLNLLDKIEELNDKIDKYQEYIRKLDDIIRKLNETQDKLLLTQEKTREEVRDAQRHLDTTQEFLKHAFTTTTKSAETDTKLLQKPTVTQVKPPKKKKPNVNINKEEKK